MYLTDKLDIANFNAIVKNYGKKIMILAGVGAGKSTWVKEVLATNNNVLFITSRRAKVDEDTNNSEFKNVINRNVLSNTHQTLVTNAKIDLFVKYLMTTSNTSSLDDFLMNYKYIVIDEVHSIASDSCFSESAYGLLDFIEYVEEFTKTHDSVIITMTGTPEPVLPYFQKKEWYICDLRTECTCIHPKRIQPIKNHYVFDTIKKELSEDNQIVYFINHASDIPLVCKKLLEKKIVSASEIAIVMSDSRENEIKEKCKKELGINEASAISELSKKSYESIILSQYLPQECKILVSTSRLKEGIDIHNSKIIAICESHVLTDLIQYFGRIRAGGGKVYVVSDANQHRLKIHNVIYLYAKYECITANLFFKKKSLECEDEKDIFIEYVCKNPYIYYSYTKKRFEIFDIKYMEEKRLANCHLNWKDELEQYSLNNNIQFPSQLDDEATIKLVNSVLAFNLGKKIYGANKDTLLHCIQSLLNIPESQMKKQISKINTLFAQKNIKYCFEAKKETKSIEGTRDKTYWVIKKK